MNYCPFDIESDPGTFGLDTVATQTHYGAFAVRVNPERSADTATVYIHGVGADWSTWTPLLQARAAKQPGARDEIFVDLPGFGASQNTIGSLKIADVGAAVLSVTASLGYEKVRVVGHSMGGFLTLDMASRYPDQIASIHLVAGPYFSILESIQHPILSFTRSPAVATVAAVFGSQYLVARTGRFGQEAIRVTYRAGFARPFLAPVASHPCKLKRSVVKALCYQQNPSGLIQTAANGPGYDADEQWGKISCPIFAVFGDKDRLVPPRDMMRLLRCQPDAACTMLKDSSHMMHVERPCEVLEALGVLPPQ